MLATRFALVLAALATTAGAAPHPECRYYFSLLNPRVFDPQEVLTRHHIDTDKVRFRVYESPKLGTSDQIIHKISLTYPTPDTGGHIHFERVTVDGKAYLQIHAIYLREGLRGKGFGTMLYLAAAIRAKELGLKIISTPNTVTALEPHEIKLGHSPEAEITWGNLVASGYAAELTQNNDDVTKVRYLLAPQNMGDRLAPMEAFFAGHRSPHP